LSNKEPYFEDIPDRRDTNSLKWGKYAGRDVIPLWVADMDFKSPPEVIERASREADFGNFGYAKCPTGLVDVVIERCMKLYGWEVDPSWIVWLPGMVCALNVSCRVFEKDSSQVFTQTPVYPPFLTAPGNFDLPCTRIPMVLNEGRFGIDFDALEALPSNPSDLFMLCHPHNPVGSAFTRDELKKFGEWVCRKDLYVCSDEIHCDLLLDPGLSHTPLALLGPEVADRAITLMAPSKTFNLPGFGCSYAIISSGKLRSRFKQAMAGIVPDPPAMGFALAESAYRTGEAWRIELIDYLRENRDFAFDELSKINGLIPFSPQATYLLWMDARNLPVETPQRFFENAGVGLSDGKDFGAPGFLRLNLGCSRQLLGQALERMVSACNDL